MRAMRSCRHIVVLSVVFLLTACELSRAPRPTAPPPTLTSAPPTITSPSSQTPPPRSSETPTLTLTEPPSPTPTVTPQPSATPLPSSTPYPSVDFRNDQMQVLDAATVARIDLTQLHLIILNVNDRSSGGNLATALPDSELAVLFYVPARNPGILRKVHEMHASVLGHIFPSADGSALVYLEEKPYRKREPLCPLFAGRLPLAHSEPLGDCAAWYPFPTQLVAGRQPIGCFDRH